MTRRILSLSFVATLLVAHPMGNFSVSHYTRLQVSSGGVDVTYVLDLAEIPTFQLLKEWKSDADAQAKEWMRGLEFRAGGKRVEPRVVRAAIVVVDCAGGLQVARM